MKNSIKYIILICTLISGTSQLQAQDFNSEKNNYLIISKNIRQLKPVLLTATDLAKEDGEKFGEFYMVICGKTVTDIPKNSAFNNFLDQATAQNVKVFVCGLSLSKFSIERDQLPANLEVTENGILYGLQLKKQGLITLSI